MKIKVIKLVVGLTLLLGLTSLVVKTHYKVQTQQIVCQVQSIPQQIQQFNETLPTLPQIPLSPLQNSENRVYDVLVNQYDMNPLEARWWARNISQAAYKEHIPDLILTAMIATESSFDINAVSSEGAVGPTQVIPAVWQDQMTYNLQDPSDNIQAGAHILHMYRVECGSWKCALAAYNVGMSAYKRNVYKRAQTRYITKINHHLSILDPHYALL